MKTKEMNVRDVRRILTLTNEVESAHGQALPGTLYDGTPTLEMETLYNIQILVYGILSRLNVKEIDNA